MEIEIIGMIILFAVIVVVSIAIVTSFGSFSSLIPNQFKIVYNRVVTSIGFKSPYNICESFSGEEISLQDFQTLLQAVYNGQCGSSHANVSLSFDLQKNDIQKIAAIDGIALDGKLIFYNITSPLGVGAILIQGDPGQYPLKLGDFIDIYSSGSPVADVLIKVTLKGCDPLDPVCNPVCALQGICQPACDDGQRHNAPCNLACIIGNDTPGFKLDPNADNVINEAIAANRIASGKCEPDCYVNFTNPYKAYDPGCVWQYKNQNDNICDPNSNGVQDGVCDPDCVNTKNICDPDCNGTVYEGNPYGLNDTKCFVCDGTCNGWCSPACNKNALPGDPGFDPDCYRQLNSSYFCSGDGICDSSRGENCANSVDCPGGGLTCGDYRAACCPSASDADISGCSNTTNISEGGSCTCGTQCAGNETCDKTSHCCPSGEVFNGTACATTCPQRISNPTCNAGLQYLTPQNIRAAYDIEPFIKAGYDGTGQNIVVIDLCGDSNIQNDLVSFDQHFGLPTAKLNVIGQFGCPDILPQDQVGWAGETALDVEWSHAIAPGATIYLYIIADTEPNMGSAGTYINNNIQNAIVSMSFGGAPDDALEAAIDQGVQKGNTFIAAVGDWCAYNQYEPPPPQGQPPPGPVSYPAGYSNVLAISGTENLAMTNCQYTSETVWNCVGGLGTGGNPSGEPEPDYQKSISAITDGKRGYGDVSLDAGDTYPIVSNGQWEGVVGTSAASPQWAGIVAVLRSAGVKNLQGNINPIIYKIGTEPNLSKQAFHDITSGSNGLPALQGWDYPTGFGTPDVVGMCEALQ